MMEYDSAMLILFIFSIISIGTVMIILSLILGFIIAYIGGALE